MKDPEEYKAALNLRIEEDLGPVPMPTLEPSR